MNRRTLTKVGIVILIVVVASLSTIRARQAWGQQQAHSGYVTARADAAIALAEAGQVGLLAGELRPLKAEKTRIDSAVAPSTSILWGSQESFYDRETAAYRAFIAHVHGWIGHVTTTARAHTATALSRLQSAIARAATYDIDAASASAELSRERTAFDNASTPGQYRTVTAAVGPVRQSLILSTDARAGYVRGVLSSSGSSLAAIVQKAKSETDGVQSPLSLISLFSTPGKRLAAEITAADSAVSAQKTPLAAAVKEADLNALVAQVSPLLKTAVPARVILVSTENQWAYAYQNGQQVFDTPVTTGGPELPTDHGVFHIYAKFSPFVFHSPWPPGSPYYYPPTPITYWMPFDRAEGLHDASWRSDFGPGSNFQPTDLGTGNYILGTHGCVNLPYDAATWVWNWAPVGTTVVVV